MLKRIFQRIIILFQLIQCYLFESSCKKGYFEHPSYGGCYKNCGIGRRNIQSNPVICLSCYSRCSSCYDKEENSCSSCRSSYKLRLDGSCMTSCLVGSFPDPKLRDTCSKCHKTCKSCSGGRADQCSVCNSDYPFKSTNGKCHQECPAGEYQYSRSQKSCKKCHSDCKTCYGGYQTHCHECQFGYKIDDIDFCIASCQNGLYNFNKTHCARCAQGCDVCSGASMIDCANCKKKNIVHIDQIFSPNYRSTDLKGNLVPIVGASLRKDYHRFCYPICRRGFYKHPTVKGANGEGECHRCHGTCFTCKGSRKNDCDSCVRNMTLNTKSGTCECDEGYFVTGNINEERGGYCKQCFKGCRRCGSGRSDDCIDCVPGYFLMGNRCLRDCGIGFYEEKAEILTGKEKCLSCSPKCGTCLGPGKNHCLSCEKPHIELVIKNEDLKTGYCLNCIEEPYHEELKTYCTYNRELNVKGTFAALDLASSSSAEIDFKEHFKLRQRIKAIENGLTQRFEVNLKIIFFI